ncbi:MAG: hypothetical protein DMG94_12270 [Acidobacteria bacterium]|nr:MAG: hypothetical protein DMG94_12270 [Acidobacteriota bacterium]
MAHHGVKLCWKNTRNFATLPPMSLLREVIVYSRKGCHLCEIVKEKLIKLERRGGFRWREVDVETDDSRIPEEIGKLAFEDEPQVVNAGLIRKAKHPWTNKTASSPQISASKSK